jgi:hypothetical protein
MPRIDVGQSAFLRKRALGPQRGRVGAANIVELGEEFGRSLGAKLRLGRF